MRKRWLVIAIAVIVLGAGGYLGFSYLSVDASAPGSDDIAVELPVEAGVEILAEGRIVPVDEATARFAANGIVQELLVAEGDRVSAGQVLARLDPRTSEQALAQAEAQQEAAQARLELAQLGPDALDLDASQASVAVARASVLSTEGAVESARAQLARAAKPATSEELAIAQHQVEQAKNALWAVQAQRDAVCGRVGKGAQEADCDAAQAGVQQAQEAVYIAELRLRQLLNKPTAEDVGVARAQVVQAEDALLVAQAQAVKTEAEALRASKSPRAEAIRVARADLAQAQVAVAQARLALERTELRAPLTGQVVQLDLELGQPVGPTAGSVRIADLRSWVVETTDLSELSVVQIQVGDSAMLRFDALPEVELEAVVQGISPLGEMTRGEIAYTVTLGLRQSDPRLAWNMTTEASITPSHVVE